jgi:hypothetical protein
MTEKNAARNCRIFIRSIERWLKRDKTVEKLIVNVVGEMIFKYCNTVLCFV